MVDIAATEQRADDLGRLFEALLTYVGRRPTLADDVLVEVLAGPEPESEPALAQQLYRRGFLRDHRRVVAERRAGDVGHERDARRRPRRRAEHRPCVRRVTLLVEPGEVVVGDDREVETRRLRR